MNNADLIVRMLKSAGVTHGFGVPSGNVLPFMEAMRTGGIEFVLTAHEGSAGFAADVTARMTGKPGLCIATLGPGATNLATGVGCAYLDRSPLIAITCTLNQAQLGRRIQMRIDHHALFKPITKATLPLRLGKIASVLAEALKIAMSEPQGPVHLDLPEDVALAPATDPVVPIPDPVSVSSAPDAHIERAAALLRAVKRPVAIIGASAMRMKSPDLLRIFVERHGIPFGVTTMAKGLIDDDHPLGIGCIERARRQLQRKFLRGTDLIIGLGYDTVEVEYEAWAGKTPILHVDIERADVDASVNVAHEAIGDLDATLERLTAPAPIRNEWSPEALQRHREEFQRLLRPVTADFSPHQVIDVVRQVLPRDGVLAFDVGAHTHQIASQWSAHAPRTFLITNGWSSMGFGIPAAIAAKIARPDLPVACIVGDGCFQMTCGEVAVAKRLGLTIPFVVLDDRWLSLIRVKQERREFAYYGTDVIPGDYSDPPAHYFGVSVVAALTPDALEHALCKAFAAAGPTVIEAMVDGSHYSETVYD
ncbi:MAG: thiamine pyrophosphate-binding protein [Betaproteobacteria bacterium]|nr:thiamine pyrophosphate-binding protein [Betaproteobacteria bacterium]